MKTRRGFIVVLSMLIAASPVYAGHDHGSQGSTNNVPSQSPVDDLKAKETELSITNCAQYVDRIQQNVRRLQAQIKEKRASNSVRDEIKKLEENLKEANSISRSLQIM